jgi:hypothetical protein
VVAREVDIGEPKLAALQHCSQLSDFCRFELEDATLIALRMEVAAFDAADGGDALSEVTRDFASSHVRSVTALSPGETPCPGRKSFSLMSRQ